MNKEKPGVQQGRGTISILDSRSHEKGDRGSNQNRATQVNQRDIKSFPKIRIQQKQPFAKKNQVVECGGGKSGEKTWEDEITKNELDIRFKLQDLGSIFALTMPIVARRRRRQMQGFGRYGRRFHFVLKIVHGP